MLCLCCCSTEYIYIVTDKNDGGNIKCTHKRLYVPLSSASLFSLFLKLKESRVTVNIPVSVTHWGLIRDRGGAVRRMTAVCVSGGGGAGGLEVGCWFGAGGWM